jgi:hypothetical protein
MIQKNDAEMSSEKAAGYSALRATGWRSRNNTQLKRDIHSLVGCCELR